MKQKPSIYFPEVTMVPVKELTKGWDIPLETMNGNSHAIISNNGKESTIVQFCSEGYTVSLNEDITREVERNLKESGLEFTRTERLWKKARFQFQYEITSLGNQTVGNKKDVIRPMIKVNNSYDGGLKFGFELGFMRLVCTNGMMVPDDSKPHHKFKMMHTESIRELVDGLMIQDNMELFAEEADEQAEHYRQLQESTFTLDQLEERIEAVQEDSKFPKRQLENVVNRLYEEIELLEAEPNDWLLYNAFNYQLQHGDINMPFHKEDALDRKVLTAIQSL